ncbi:MAG: PAS domain S-box protein [Sedimentisphaerales bacterium]|nr:PAS domain S-box protein [Sedimentisphaerales bacterium]
MSGDDRAMTVLVVEDQEDLLRLMQRILQQEGFETAGAASGRETLEWLRRHTADLLLLDFRLPDMTGRQVVQTLRDEGRPVPFILVTGHGDERLAVEMMKIGARDYLTKDGPFLELLPSVLGQVATQLRHESQLRQAEKALRESEAQYRGIFNAVRDAVLVVDFAGRIVDANPQAAQMFGYEPEEFFQLPLRNLIVSDQQHFFEKCIQDIQSQGSFQAETVGIQKDGTTHDIDLRGSVFIFKGKNHIVVLIRDISERKWAEEELKLTNQQLRISEKALREREARLQAIFRGAAVGIALVDLGGHALESNPALEEMLAYNRMELRQQTMEQIAFPTDRKAFSRIFTDMVQGRCDHYQMEIRFVRKDGRTIWVRLTASLVRGESGIPNYVIHMIEDITDRKQAEDSLQENEAKYRSLFENMMSGFAYHRMVTDEAGRPVDYVFLEVNEAFERMTGLRRDRILHKKVSELLPQLRTSEFDWIDTYGQVALTGREARFEQYCEDLGRWYAVSAYSPRPGHFATLFEDVTDRRLMEEELRMFTVDLEQSIRQLEQFACLVSHDLEEPLGQIRRECEKLQSKYQQTIDTRDAETLDRVVSQVRQVQHVLRGLLDYSRIQSQTVSMETLDLNELVRRIVDEHQSDIDQCRARLEIDALPQVFGVPGQLRQVFENLIDNALRFRSDSAPEIRIESRDTPIHWEIIVRDNGVGIAPDELDTIFLRFGQLPVTDRSAAGFRLGLGLALCKKIVERHGGRIWVESQPGRGSAFHLTLPKKDGAPVPSPAENAAPPP